MAANGREWLQMKKIRPLLPCRKWPRMAANGREWGKNFWEYFSLEDIFWGGEMDGKKNHPFFLPEKNAVILSSCKWVKKG